MMIEEIREELAKEKESKLSETWFQSQSNADKIEIYKILYDKGVRAQKDEDLYEFTEEHFQEINMDDLMDLEEEIEETYGEETAQDLFEFDQREALKRSLGL